MHFSATLPRPFGSCRATSVWFHPFQGVRIQSGSAPVCLVRSFGWGWWGEAWNQPQASSKKNFKTQREHCIRPQASQGQKDHRKDNQAAEDGQCARQCPMRITCSWSFIKLKFWQLWWFQQQQQQWFQFWFWFWPRGRTQISDEFWEGGGEGNNWHSQRSFPGKLQPCQFQKRCTAAAIPDTEACSSGRQNPVQSKGRSCGSLRPASQSFSQVSVLRSSNSQRCYPHRVCLLKDEVPCVCAPQLFFRVSCHREGQCSGGPSFLQPMDSESQSWQCIFQCQRRLAGFCDWERRSLDPAIASKVRRGFQLTWLMTWHVAVGIEMYITSLITSSHQSINESWIMNESWVMNL